MARASGELAAIPLACLGCFALFWVALAIEPIDRATWALENIVPLAGVAFVATAYPRVRWSDRACVLGTLFLLLHAIGSHYTYSATPIGEWWRDATHAERNHYDRLVHFAFGLLMFSAIREVFLRSPLAAPALRKLGLTFAVLVTWSTLYELIEWLTAIVVDPAAGVEFLAAQGDEWDAQKDMTCAALGSLLGAAWEWPYVREAQPHERLALAGDPFPHRAPRSQAHRS